MPQHFHEFCATIENKASRVSSGNRFTDFFSILVLNDVFYLVVFFYSTECSNKVLFLQLLLFKMDHETVGADDPRPESPIDNPLQCRYCGKVFTR